MNIVLAFINLLFAAVCSYRLVLCYQQSGYKRTGVNTYNNRLMLFSLPAALVSIIGAALEILNVYTNVFYFSSAIALLFMLPWIKATLKENYKKPLVFTKRAVRLIAVYLILLAAWNILVITPARALAFVYYPVLPFFLIAADIVLTPLEKLINRKYLAAAGNTLSRPGLIKIGITGSYGKTSVKNILTAMLSAKYRVISTPASFNTPLGIARATKSVTPGTEVFIAEMGARRKGDIAELVRLVKPSFGIVTAVNSQHLETFKSVENTAAAKYELIEGLLGEKKAVFNADNTYTAEMAERTPGAITAGCSEGADYRVEKIMASMRGSSFEIVSGGSRYAFLTQLLGAHNALNIAIAAAMARTLNVPWEDIKQAVFDLKPMPHRLEMVRGARNITILDDTYNSNPDGAASAVEALSCFPGRKVAVTPGLIELGAAERNENILLGRRLADVCGLIILIKSRQTPYIREGLREFPESGVLEYPSLQAATEDFQRVLKSGDTLLLLNDLPDSEA